MVENDVNYDPEHSDDLDEVYEYLGYDFEELYLDL